MKFKILASIFLVILLIFSPSIVKAPNPLTVMVLDDTYVKAEDSSATFGEKSYLMVEDSDEGGLAFAFLMFNLSGVSYTFNATSEIKLRLCCLNTTSPQDIGVRHCLNNTWDGNNLTYTSSTGFSVSYPESFVTVSSKDDWYEWIVTQIVRDAFEKGYILTLVLKVRSTYPGVEYASFYSKETGDNGPRLVFTYFTPSNFMDTAIKIAFVSIVIVGVIFVAYWFSRKKKKEKRYRKSRFQKSVRSTK